MLTGFAMAFYMLLPMVPAFSSPISAALKVFVMMLGEFQMEDYFTVEQVRYTKNPTKIQGDSKSVTLKLHLLFKKNLAGYLKTPKVARISAMYTNFSHPPYVIKSSPACLY